MGITKQDIFTTHLCLTGIQATTAAILVDLSDTTNFPHDKADGNIYIFGYQVSINGDTSWRGQVSVGFLENVDGSNGDLKTFLISLKSKHAAILTSFAEHRTPGGYRLIRALLANRRNLLSVAV